MPIASQVSRHLLPTSASLLLLAPLQKSSAGLSLSFSVSSCTKFPFSTHDLCVPSCCIPSLARSSFSVSITTLIVTFLRFLPFPLNSRYLLSSTSSPRPPFQFPNSKYLSSIYYVLNTEFFTSLYPSRSPTYLLASPSSSLVSLHFVPITVSRQSNSLLHTTPSSKRKDTLKPSLCLCLSIL